MEDKSDDSRWPFLVLCQTVLQPFVVYLADSKSNAHRVYFFILAAKQAQVEADRQEDEEGQ